MLKGLGKWGYDGNKKKNLLKNENGGKMESAECMDSIICLET